MRTCWHRLHALMYISSCSSPCSCACPTGRVVQALLLLVDQQAHTFKLGDVHMTIWGFAKLQRQLPPDLMHLLASRVLHRC